MKLLIALILTLTIYSNGFNLNSQNRFQNNKVPIISTSPIKEYAYNKLASRVARVQPLFGANLTEVTKDKLLKNAQQLRESADLLEKQSTEKNQTDQAVFISTYAIKSAPIRDPKNINNITVISRNETNMYKNAIIVEERAAKSDSSEKEKKTKLLYEDMDGLRLEAVDSYVESVMTAQKQEAKKNLIENIRKELKSEITAKTISEVMASLFYYQETVRSLEQDSGDGYFKSIANIIEFDYLEQNWKDNPSFLDTYLSKGTDPSQASLTAATAIHPLLSIDTANEILQYTDLIVTFAKDEKTGVFKCFPKDFRVDISRLEEQYISKKLPIREIDRVIARTIVSGNKDEFYSYIGIEGFFFKGMLKLMKSVVVDVASNIFASATGTPSSELSELISLLLIAEIFTQSSDKSATESASALVTYLAEIESDGAAVGYYISCRAKLIQILIRKEVSKSRQTVKLFDTPTLYSLTDGAPLLNNVKVEELLTSKGDTVAVSLQRFSERIDTEKSLEGTVGVGARVPLTNLPATVNKDFFLFNLNMYCENLRGQFKSILREASGISAPTSISPNSEADSPLFIPITLAPDSMDGKVVSDSERSEQTMVSEMKEKLLQLLGDKSEGDTKVTTPLPLTAASKADEKEGKESEVKDTKNKSWMEMLKDQLKETESRLSELEDETNDVSLPKTLVDTLMRDYFDPLTRKQASVVTRVGAGLFQAEVLKGLFDTTGVTKMDGAYVFDGRQVVRSSKNFYEKFYKKFKESPFADKLDFIITTNQRFPGSNDTMTDMVYSVMEKKTSVIIYPKNWNSTIAPTPEQIKGRRLVNLLNPLSSVIVAGNCYNIFDPDGPFAQTGVLPDGFQGLVILPILLQLVPVMFEMYVAFQKGVKLNFVNLPGWFSLPTFGYRAIYENRAKTRNDLFDIAASGWFLSFILSLVTSIVGLQLTAAVSPDDLATLPSIPLMLLKSNPLVMQLFEGELPATAAALSVAGAAKDSLVHLHWLAIAGLFSMIANTLQLIPSRQTAGSKMLYALKGHGEFYLFSQVIVLIRTLFLAIWTVQSFFLPGNLFLITGKQSMVVTFLFSEVQGSLPDTSIEQLADDDVTDITESRKIAFAGFSFLLLFVLISDSVVAIFQDLVSFLQTVSSDQVSQMLDFSVLFGSNLLQSPF